MRPFAFRFAVTRHHGGFTLMEAIVVIVVTGILASTMVLFIRKPVQNYVDAVGRAELTDAADLALLRISRELRGALSNSIRVTTINNVGLLEFIPTKAGGIYLSADDNAAGTPLAFPGGASFTVYGPMPVAPNNIQQYDYIVVYNLGTGMQYADAYAGVNRVQVTLTPSGNSHLVNTAVNTFNANMQSPGHRFSVVRQPVTFRCGLNAQGQTELKRYWNYGFLANQVDPGDAANGLAPSSAILASNVASCSFAYTVLVNQPSGLVGVTISQGRANSTEAATLVHQIHVDNTP